VITTGKSRANGAVENSCLVCVADVAGKGLDASLLMSNMQATLHALLGQFTSLIELAAKLNSRVFESSPPNKFITAILLEINPATGDAIYVNAGHTGGILQRADGRSESLESTGMALGVMPQEMLVSLGNQYEERLFSLQTGDILALYSDGVTEANDEHERQWGEDKLRACLNAVSSDSAQAIVAKVLSEVDQFSGSAPQHDDITLLVLKRAVCGRNDPGKYLQAGRA